MSAVLVYWFEEKNWSILKETAVRVAVPGVRTTAKFQGKWYPSLIIAKAENSDAIKKAEDDFRCFLNNLLLEEDPDNVDQFIIDYASRDERIVQPPLVLEVSQQPEFTETLTDLTAMEEKPMTLTCTVVGLPRPEVAWLKDGKELVATPNIKQSYDDDTAVLTIKKMSIDMDGEYKCIAENSAGSSETAAKVVVEGKMEAPGNTEVNNVGKAQAYTNKVSEAERTAKLTVEGEECCKKFYPTPQQESSHRSTRKLEKRMSVIESEIKTLKRKLKLLEEQQHEGQLENTLPEKESSSDQDGNPTSLLETVKHVNVSSDSDVQECVKRMCLTVFQKEELVNSSRTGKKTIKSGETIKPGLDTKKMMALESAALQICPGLSRDVFKKKIDNIIKMERRKHLKANENVKC